MTGRSGQAAKSGKKSLTCETRLHTTIFEFAVNARSAFVEVAGKIDGIGIPAPTSAYGKVESISSGGSAMVHRPTTRAGIPATVVCGGTSFKTMLQSATFAPTPSRHFP